MLFQMGSILPLAVTCNARGTCLDNNVLLLLFSDQNKCTNYMCSCIIYFWLQYSVVCHRTVEQQYLRIFWK